MSKPPVKLRTSYFSAKLLIYPSVTTTDKQTRNGINRLINDKKNRKQVISSLKRPDDNNITNDPLEISSILNNYFSSVAKNLASRVPRSSRNFTEYLSPNYNPSSFFFDLVSPAGIEREILLIPKNKTYVLYSYVRFVFKLTLDALVWALSPSLQTHLCKRGSYHPN